MTSPAKTRRHQSPLLECSRQIRLKLSGGNGLEEQTLAQLLREKFRNVCVMGECSVCPREGYECN